MEEPLGFRNYLGGDPERAMTAVRATGHADSGTRRPARRVREGFALVVALLAIVMIGALVAGVSFATTEETRIGRAVVAREAALVAAESAIAMEIGSPSTAFPRSIGVGGTVSHPVYGLGYPVTIYVTGLDSGAYWIVADSPGRATGGGSGQRIGIVVRTVADSGNSATIAPASPLSWSQLF